MNLTKILTFISLLIIFNNIRRVHMHNGSEIIIGRPQYLEQLKKWKNQPDLIKIITGVRRCGKSKLFYLYQFDLLANK